MGKNEEYSGLLEGHGVRATANRVMIARAMGEAGRPVSLNCLESILDTVDKSVIFRTLIAFKQHGLVHLIEDGDGRTLYELCHSRREDEDDDEHVHFFCERCHATFCLTGIAPPRVALPSGYVARSASYVVTGLCPKCSSAFND